jgi:hypothetical protein
VLDVDIKGCFDNISHNYLLDTLKHFPPIEKNTYEYIYGAYFFITQAHFEMFNRTHLIIQCYSANRILIWLSLLIQNTSSASGQIQSDALAVYDIVSPMQFRQPQKSLSDFISMLSFKTIYYILAGSPLPAFPSPEAPPAGIRQRPCSCKHLWINKIFRLAF